MVTVLSRSQHLKLVKRNQETPLNERSFLSMPLRADWQRILLDVQQSGVIRLKTSNTAASISHRGVLFTMKSKDDVSLIQDADMSISCFLPHWAMASISKGWRTGDHDSLQVNTYSGVEIFQVGLTEESLYENFHSLLVKQWAQKSPPQLLSDDKRLFGSLEILGKLNESAGQCISDHWFEIKGRELSGIPVNPALIAPFLETMVDQYCQFQVTVGNQGVLHQFNHAYFDLHQSFDNLRLWSRDAELLIDLTKVTAARIIQHKSTTSQFLHLYDASGRCVMSMSQTGSTSKKDRKVWQAMLKALRT